VKYIESVIDSVLQSEQPSGGMEIIVVDGMSDDGTRQVLSAVEKRAGGSVRVLDNPNRVTPYALNLGIRAARGKIIVRLDAHAYYEGDYFVRCVEWLEKSGADNVGGIWVVEATEDTWVGRAVARSINHPFGSGNAHYKTGVSQEPRYVDTVPFGCFRRDVFDRVGYFREDLARSQDMEFNVRLRERGGKILLVPSIKARYQARSGLRRVIPYYFSNGFWVLFPLKFGARVFKWRHLAPLVFVLSLCVFGLLSIWSTTSRAALALVVAAYGLLAIASAVQTSVRERRLEYLVTLPLAFGMLHLVYGVGALYAGVCLVLERLLPSEIFRKASPTHRV
jgi:glycosyltransferase involved in cell wall biosynthesis